MKTLTQKNGRNSKYFEIQDNGVFVKDNFMNDAYEFKIHFEDIYEEETVSRKSKDFVLIILAISMLFNGIFLSIIINDYYNFSYPNGLFVFIACIIPALVTIGFCNNEFKNEASKHLSAKRSLKFHYNKDDKEKVDLFISNIKESKKDFYLKEYYKVDNLIPTQVQIARIHWLYECKYITESDAKFILDELNSKRIIEGM